MVVVFAHQVVPLFPEIAGAAVKRPFGYGFAAFIPANPYVPFAVMLTAALYALIVQALIYQFFEKTQSPEIYFFALFVFSFTFECGRILIPLQHLYMLPQTFIAAAGRMQLFGRFFGLFALFASSVYAAGLKAQKQGTVFFAVTLAAMLFAVRVPVDALAWDTALRLNCGYRSMFWILEVVLALLSVAGYFVSARIRGGKEFVPAGIGVFLVAFGRTLLLDADTPYAPVLAFVCLVAGTWLVCAQLHRIYLWM
jgi:hypothetical protein